MNLAEHVERAVERLGDRLCLDFEGQRFTYRQVLDGAQRMQTALAAFGFARGTNAVVSMLNNPLLFPAMQAIFRTGAAAVPVMPQAAAAKLRYVIEDTQAACVLCDEPRLATVREAVAGLSCVQRILVQGSAPSPAHPADSASKTPSETALESLLDFAPFTMLPAISEDDVAVILYSSGTTGRPKGVLLTHGNLLAAMVAINDAAQLDSWQGPRITVSAMPIAHIFGVAIMNDLFATPPHLADASLLVLMRWFDPERFMAMIQEHRCTTMPAVPTMLALLLNHPRAGDYDLSSLQEVICGGAPLSPELAQAFMQRFPCRIREVYGLTEATGMGSVNRRTETYRAGSAGRAYCNTELRIADDAGHDVPTNSRGEICLRGPTVMKGYHNRPQDTADAIRDGWLHTGDIGYLDQDGHVYVVDRKKDMIIRGGENIYPAELEDVLYAHEAVAEAAVVGAPDAVYGESVVAFVVLRSGTCVDQDQIIEHVGRHVARFKAPSRVYFIDALPKSNIGKVLRRVLRERAAEAI